MMQFRTIIPALLFIGLTACAGNPNSPIALQCEHGLKAAYHELDIAKAKGFDGTVEYTKAAALLGAAKIQNEFGKYPNCIDKVRRAREYIKKSQR